MPNPFNIRKEVLACGLGLALLASNASANFIVNLPWVRPAKSGQSTELYMNLTSTDGATLVALRTDEAAVIVLRGPGGHKRTISSLPLPANVQIALAPGKARIALIRLNRIVKLGEHVEVTLTIEGADGTRVDIPVRAEARMRSPLDDELRAHHHTH
jgi:copper(I)-binding protein